jgi:hypothetical protein
MAEYPDQIFTATGRRLLEQQLDTQRAEIAKLLDGLTEGEARASLVPSLTTLLGLVKHSAFVERVWFHHRVAGASRVELGIPDEVNDSFRMTDDDTIGSVRADHAAACAGSREIATAHPDLTEDFKGRRGPVTLAFIYTHCIQELARHAGHGDILREQLIARRNS